MKGEVVFLRHLSTKIQPKLFGCKEQHELGPQKCHNPRTIPMVFHIWAFGKRQKWEATHVRENSMTC